MPDFSDMLFKRQFSLTMRKNKKFKLSEMSFFKDFINDTRGDLYPVFEKCGEFTEGVSAGKYYFTGACSSSVVRVMGSYFPYASYELVPEELDGSCGFSFISEGTRADILFSVKDGRIMCRCKDELVDTGKNFVKGCALIVTARKQYFDVFINLGHMAEYICTFNPDGFENAISYSFFSGAVCGLFVSGRACITSVSSYMDCGLSQADIRPIRYEDGSVMVENGKIYLTMSVRLIKDMYQGVFSWIPGTAEFELTGAIFFDGGDGVWNGDVASSILYHRTEKKWLIWSCGFSHGHILCHAVSKGDVRFGINCVDVELMEKMPEGCPDTEFLGKCPDEDPDFLYDEKSGKWFMAICRTTKENGGDYKYHIFESQNPFDGYSFVGANNNGAETGGSFINTDDGIYFICGNDYFKRANYRVYKLPDMKNYTELKFDYDDGGFRGWGTVIPINKGTRTEYYHITFDRSNASDFNWSYGNIYCFKA